MEEWVSLELETDQIPVHPNSHTGPALMFNRKKVDYGKIEEEIGSDKISSTCLVNATTSSHDSVWISHLAIHWLCDPSCASWLWSQGLEQGHRVWYNIICIEPHKDPAVSLKKERCNHFVYLCAVTLHHEADLKGNLEKYDTITSTLACTVRAFQDVEFINVFLVCSALLGVHLIEPYLSLTYFNPVDY